MKKHLLLIIGLVIALFASGCKTDSIKSFSRTGLHMSTVIKITVYGGKGEKTLDKAFGEIVRLESLLSRTMEGSDIYNINEAAGSGNMAVSQDTVNVISKSLQYYEFSKGYFDITIGPLVELWGIGTENAAVPSQEQLESALKNVNIDKMKLSNNTVELSEKGMVVDVGGIAKGYIADAVAEVIKEDNCTGAVINLGGNVLTIGRKPDGSKWRIGIQDPAELTGIYMEVVEVEEMSVVTSGPYERHFEEGGNIYHHILNPFTGYPVESDITGITIISRKSIDGDGLSTSVFAMGTEEGLKLIESTDSTECYIVLNDGTVIMSSGFADFLH